MIIEVDLTFHTTGPLADGEGMRLWEVCSYVNTVGRHIYRVKSEVTVNQGSIDSNGVLVAGELVANMIKEHLAREIFVTKVFASTEEKPSTITEFVRT